MNRYQANYNTNKQQQQQQQQRAQNKKKDENNIEQQIRLRIGNQLQCTDAKLSVESFVRVAPHYLFDCDSTE